jgi:hypothetical protein
MCDIFKDGYCGNALTEKQLEELAPYLDGDGPQICVHSDEEANKELKRIHEESVKRYGTCIDHTKDKLIITGKNTATYYQEIYEMDVEDTVIVEEDDGYCD